MRELPLSSELSSSVELEVKTSSIDRYGVFSKQYIAPQTRIGIAFVYSPPSKLITSWDDNIHRTKLGAYVNHSTCPKCILTEVIEDKSIFYYYCSVIPINIDDELTVDYSLFPWDGKRNF